MSLAPALTAHGSGRFQSCGTEIGLALRGYAGAVSLSPSLTEADVRRPVMLGSMGWGGAASPREYARVAGWQEGDLSPAGLESPEGRTARAGGLRGTH